MGRKVFSLGIDASELVKAFKQLNELTAGLQSRFGELAKRFKEFADNNAVLSPLMKGFTKLGSVLSKAFAPLGIAFSVAKGVLSVFKNIIMLPFGIIGKAFSGLKAAWDFFADAAQGSLNRAAGAREARTSYGRYKALERAGELNGYDLTAQMHGMANAINDPSKAHIFAGLGLDPNQLRKMDGTQALFKIYEAMQSKGLGEDSMAAQALFNDLGLGDIVDVDTWRGMQKVLPRIVNDFNSLHKRFANLEAVERASKRLGFAFEDVKNKLTAKFAPILTPLVNRFSQILSPALDTLLSNENVTALTKKLEELATRFSKFIGDPAKQKEWLKSLNDKFNALIDVMKLIAQNILNGLAWIPGVDGKKMRALANSDFLKTKHDKITADDTQSLEQDWYGMREEFNNQTGYKNTRFAEEIDRQLTNLFKEARSLEEKEAGRQFGFDVRFYDGYYSATLYNKETGQIIKQVKHRMNSPTN